MYSSIGIDRNYLMVQKLLSILVGNHSVPCMYIVLLPLEQRVNERTSYIHAVSIIESITE